MSFPRNNNNNHLLFTTAFVVAILFGHTSPGRAPNLSVGPRYSPTRTWAFFLLPGSMWGRVGSQTKQNSQGRPGQDSNVAFIDDVNGLSQYKDKTKDEGEKSQVPPLKDVKTVRKSTLLHSAWVIIAIVLTIVLFAAAIYYWVLFYPILCKEERKYDVMQMSAKP